MEILTKKYLWAQRGININWRKRKRKEKKRKERTREKERKKEYEKSERHLDHQKKGKKTSEKPRRTLKKVQSNNASKKGKYYIKTILALISWIVFGVFYIIETLVMVFWGQIWNDLNWYDK